MSGRCIANSALTEHRHVYFGCQTPGQPLLSLPEKPTVKVTCQSCQRNNQRSLPGAHPMHPQPPDFPGRRQQNHHILELNGTLESSCSNPFYMKWGWEGHGCIHSHCVCLHTAFCLTSHSSNPSMASDPCVAILQYGRPFSSLIFIICTFIPYCYWSARWPCGTSIFLKKNCTIHTCHLLFYFLQKNHLLAYSNSKEVLTLWLAITGVEARFTGKMNK